jgi:hypothetical protein
LKLMATRNYLAVIGIMLAGLAASPADAGSARRNP